MPQYLSKEQFQNKQIVIQKSSKGHSIVIVDHILTSIKKMENFLSEKKKNSENICEIRKFLEFYSRKTH